MPNPDYDSRVTIDNKGELRCDYVEVTKNKFADYVDVRFHFKNTEDPRITSTTTVPLPRHIAHDLMRELRNYL
jgi:hypothetical protein